MCTVKQCFLKGRLNAKCHEEKNAKIYKEVDGQHLKRIIPKGTIPNFSTHFRKPLIQHPIHTSKKTAYSKAASVHWSDNMFSIPHV